MIQRKTKIPLIKDVMNPLDGPFKRMNYDFEFIEKEQLDLLFSLSFGERPVAPLIEFYIDTNGDNVSLSEVSKETISSLVLSMNRKNWDKLKEVFKVEYDPIRNFSDDYLENISDTEKNALSSNGSKTDTGSDTRTVSTGEEFSGNKQFTGNDVESDATTSTNTTTNNLTKTETRDLSVSENQTDTGNGAITRTDNLSELETRNLSNSKSETDVQQTTGFNSAAMLDKDKDTLTVSNTDSGTVKKDFTGTQENSETRNFAKSRSASDSGSITTADTGTKTDSIESEKTLTKTLNDSETVTNTNQIEMSDNGQHQYTVSKQSTQDENKSYTRVKKVTRKGNIGNITTQKMLNEEIELWKWNFVHQILSDVKKTLTLSVYSS